MQDANDIQIPVVILLVVEAPDDMHLGAARLNGLAAPGQYLLVIHPVAAVFPQVGAEGAEDAAIHADICRVEVGVDVVVAGVAVFSFPDKVG